VRRDEAVLPEHGVLWIGDVGARVQRGEASEPRHIPHEASSARVDARQLPRYRGVAVRRLERVAVPFDRARSTLPDLPQTHANSRGGGHGELALRPHQGGAADDRRVPREVVPVARLVDREQDVRDGGRELRMGVHSFDPARALRRVGLRLLPEQGGLRRQQDGRTRVVRRLRRRPREDGRLHRDSPHPRGLPAEVLADVLGPDGRRSSALFENPLLRVRRSRCFVDARLLLERQDQVVPPRRRLLRRGNLWQRQRPAGGFGRVAGRARRAAGVGPVAPQDCGTSDRRSARPVGADDRGEPARHLDTRRVELHRRPRARLRPREGAVDSVRPLRLDPVVGDRDQHCGAAALPCRCRVHRRTQDDDDPVRDVAQRRIRRAHRHARKRAHASERAGLRSRALQPDLVHALRPTYAQGKYYYPHFPPRPLSSDVRLCRVGARVPQGGGRVLERARRGIRSGRRHCGDRACDCREREARNRGPTGKSGQRRPTAVRADLPLRAAGGRGRRADVEEEDRVVRADERPRDRGRRGGDAGRVRRLRTRAALHPADGRGLLEGELI